MRAPYTILRRNTYHFNQRIRQNAVRLSLQTNCKRQAFKLAAGLNEVVETVQIERAKLESIRRAAKSWLQRNLEVATIAEASKPPVDNGGSESARVEEQREQDAAAKNAKDLIRDREHSAVFHWDSEKLSQEFNLGLSDEHLKILAYHIAQANVVFWNKLQAKELIDFEEVGSSTIPYEASSHRRFSELVDEYLDGIKREVKEKSLREYRTSLRVALEIIGDPPMTEFTRKS